MNLLSTSTYSNTFFGTTFYFLESRKYSHYFYFLKSRILAHISTFLKVAKSSTFDNTAQENVYRVVIIKKSLHHCRSASASTNLGREFTCQLLLSTPTTAI